MASVLIAQSPSRPVVKYTGHHYRERIETLNLGLIDQVAFPIQESWEGHSGQKQIQAKANKPEIYQTSWKVLKRELS